MSTSTTTNTPAARTRNPIGVTAAALRRRALYLLAAGSVALAACGGADASVDAPAAAPAPAVAAPTTQPPTTQAPTTLAPTTQAPTTLAPEAGGLPDHLRSLQPGDCVAGSGFGEELHEAPCPAEGTVLSVVADSDATCTSGNQTISGSSTSTDGDRREYTLCVQSGALSVTPIATASGPAALESVFTIPAGCEDFEPITGEHRVVRCGGAEANRYFVELEVGADEYLRTLGDTEQVGTWSVDGVSCGADHIATFDDGTVLLVSTFDSAPYAVLDYSEVLSVDELRQASDWTVDPSVCTA